jgi:hypothetical protein
MVRETKYFIGVDLGKRQDYTAIAVVEREKVQVWGKDWITLKSNLEGVVKRYRLRGLRRLAKGTRYEEAARVVREVAGKLHPREIVIDATGVGDAVVEMVEKAAGAVTEVVITSGESGRMSNGRYLAPKKDLLERIAVMLEQGELEISGALKLRRELREELLGMRLIRTKEGRTRYEGKPHDDLVLAAALACWRARSRGEWGDQPNSLGLG